MHSYDEMSTCRSELTARDNTSRPRHKVFHNFETKLYAWYNEVACETWPLVNMDKLQEGHVVVALTIQLTSRASLLPNVLKTSEDICDLTTFETLLYTRSQICYWHGQVCMMEITVKPCEAYPLRLR